jgi:hypothetical protein
MNKLCAALTIAAVALPTSSLPSVAAGFGQGGSQATIESAPAANGKKSYYKNLQMECTGTTCIGEFKGKTGRTTTITEMQCAGGTDGQAIGVQVYMGMTIVELLPIASRGSDGVTETSIARTATNFSIEGQEKVLVGYYFYGTPTFASCILKGTSEPS